VERLLAMDVDVGLLLRSPRRLRRRPPDVRCRPAAAAARGKRAGMAGRYFTVPRVLAP
jgi:hypothetical protein